MNAEQSSEKAVKQHVQPPSKGPSSGRSGSRARTSGKPALESTRPDQAGWGVAIRRLIAIVAFPAVLAGFVLLVILFWDKISLLFTSVERFRDWVQTRNVLAPLIFIAAQSVQVVIFVLPGEVPQIAGGYLFGFWIGSLLSVAGILLGSAASFMLARALGVPFVRALFAQERVNHVRRMAESSRARLLFFLVFLFPGVPKDVVCYAAGLTAMKLPVFLLISMTARLPGIFGSALLGKAAAQERWLLAGSLAVAAIVLFLLGYLFRERLHKLVARLSSHDKGHSGR